MLSNFHERTLCVRIHVYDTIHDVCLLLIDMSSIVDSRTIILSIAACDGRVIVGLAA